MQQFHITAASNNGTFKHSRMGCQTNQSSALSIGLANNQSPNEKGHGESVLQELKLTNSKPKQKVVNSNSKCKQDNIRTSSHSPY